MYWKAHICVLALLCLQAVAYIAPASQSTGRHVADSIRVRNHFTALSATVEDEAAARAAAAAAAIEEEEEAEKSKSVLLTNVPRVEEGFPLSMVVGQEAIKSALLLAGINTRMGGVVISGRRGTAKSVMAKALHRLLPPIEKIKGSPYNIDPENPREIDDFTATMLEKEGKTLKDLETEIVPPPFVQVPLNVLEDRLLGSVDVEASVKEGKTVFSPGLLASAHRGVLYVDDINLLDEEMANILLSVISDGVVNVQREGINVRYPCRPLLVATFNPEEADLRDHLMDRIAVSLSADAEELSLEQRLEVVDSVIDFGDAAKNPALLEQALALEDQLKTRIIFARETLKELRLAPEQILYLCEEAIRAGCQGHRAEIFASEVAKAHAALNDRDRVDADDLRMAVKLAILPRGTYIEQMMDDEMMPPPPPPPPPPTPQAQDESDLDQEMEDKDEDAEEEKEDEEPPEQEEQEDTDDAPSVPQEFMFDADTGVPMDDDLLKFAGKQRSGKGGGRGLIFSNERGRYIKPMMPKGKVTRLAVDATLRAAAPYQRARRARSAGTKYEGRGVFIEQSDVRVKKMARKAGSLILFVVDASGSMALNRMNAVKGAAMNMLQEAYQSRDKISIIPFQGDSAEVLLPPTRSIAMARNRLETMPCGGGSPLAHALTVAMRTGLNAQKSGDVGKVVVVLLTDGRANVGLAQSLGEVAEEGEKPDRAALKEEVLAVAAQLRALGGFHLLVMDSENKFVSTGVAKEIAAAAGGKYHFLAKTTQNAISNAAQSAIADIKAN